MRRHPAVRDGDVSRPQTVLAFVIHQNQVQGVSILERISHGDLIPLSTTRPVMQPSRPPAPCHDGRLAASVPGRFARYISGVAHADCPALVPGHPSRPTRPARTRQGGCGGVRPGDRPGRQRDRTRLSADPSDQPRPTVNSIIERWAWSCRNDCSTESPVYREALLLPAL